MMRAKLQVNEVIKHNDHSVEVKMAPVCSKPFDPNDESEDNSYARWTPCGAVSLTITNPDLLNKFSVGQKFYADFTPAAD